MFDSVLPYDRRRHHSQPGGVPTVDALWSATGARTLVELTGDDLVAELAQQLLSGKPVLIDAGAALGCVCSGAVSGVAPRDARQRVLAIEPPRAPTPIVDDERVGGRRRAHSRHSRDRRSSDGRLARRHCGDRVPRQRAISALARPARRRR